MERKRLKTQENKSLIESYVEISKMNFETLKMWQKMKIESKMSEDVIAALFPLLEYPPKPFSVECHTYACRNYIVLNFVFKYNYFIIKS